MLCSKPLGYGSPTRFARLVPKLSFRPPASAAGDRHREPSLERRDAVDLPAADDGVLHAGGVSGELLPLAERQVVDEAPDEPVVHVEVRAPAIELRAAVVEQALPAVEPGRADAGRGRLVVGALRPGVDDGRHERAGMTLELRVHRVVVGVAREVAVDVHLEVRERLALPRPTADWRDRRAAPARCSAASAGSCPWCRCSSPRQWCSVNSSRWTPRDHCCTYGFFGLGDMLTARNVLAAGVAAPRSAKLGNSWFVVWRGVVWPDGLVVVAAADVRIDVRGAVDLPPLERVPEHPVAAADHRGLAAERPEREADAGRKDVLRGILRIPPVRRTCSSSNRRRCPCRRASDRPRAVRRAGSRDRASPCGRSIRSGWCGSPSGGPGSA